MLPIYYNSEKKDFHIAAILDYNEAELLLNYHDKILSKLEKERQKLIDKSEGKASDFDKINDVNNKIDYRNASKDMCLRIMRSHRNFESLS